MKKILGLLLVLFLALPSFAVQVQTIRVIKEVNAATISKLNSNYSFGEYCTALYNAFNNDYYWRAGWNQKVTADIPQMLAMPIDDNLYSPYAETFKPQTKQAFVYLFYKAAECAYKEKPNKMDAETIRKIKYGSK